MTTPLHEIEIVEVPKEQDQNRIAHLSCGVCYALDKLYERDHKALCGHVFPKIGSNNWTTKCIVCMDLESTHPHFNIGGD